MSTDSIKFFATLAGTLGMMVSANCVTSIDAIADGEDGHGAITVATGVTTAATTGGSGNLDTPCGSFYDWDSCSVDGLGSEVPLAQAREHLVGAWRRCNETGDGLFPVGVFFQEDGSLYRMFRRDNDTNTGTDTVTYCSNSPLDAGTWALSEAGGGLGSGGGGGGVSAASPFALTIEWAEGGTTVVPLAVHQAGFSLRPVDGPAEEFMPQAASTTSDP